MEDGADEPDGGSFSSELPDRTEEQAPRAPVNGGIRRCRPAPWTRCAAALRGCGWRGGGGGGGGPGAPELGGRWGGGRGGGGGGTPAGPGARPVGAVCLEALGGGWVG